MADFTQCQKQIDDLLSLPQQMWLLGAGISKNAGIPLMYPLTDRVGTILEGVDKQIFQDIRNDLPETAHVEHVLSHLGDLIALAGRAKDKSVMVQGTLRSDEVLEATHNNIQRAIRDTMRWGYVPSDPGPEEIGDSGKPIVKVEGHLQFVEALFYSRRTGLEQHRPPVVFFTTNYDTLLEDALALCRIRVDDGFCGGAMAFWDPGQYSKDPFASDPLVQARLFKLHGSIDWVISPKDIVVRRREGAGYPDEPDTKLLIYPQATKYKVIQRDPFATLFGSFRSALVYPQLEGLLAICGYSFGDDHINEEIERALKQRGNALTVLIFTYQDMDKVEQSEKGLPVTLAKWLSPASDPWRERIVVASNGGVFRGSLENEFPCQENTSYDWWTFEGVSRLLRYGPEANL